MNIEADNTPANSVVVVVIWIILCTGLFTIYQDRITQNRLSGPDDYMRLTAAYQLVDDGQWYKTAETRISPPHSVILHWTRIPDLLPAVVIYTFDHWFGRPISGLVAATLSPLLLLLLFLLLMVWASRPILLPQYLPIGLYVAVFSIPLVMQFVPGRIDHHQWQILGALLSAGFLYRLQERPGNWRPAVLAAVCSSVGLWIGTEAVAWLIAFCAAMWLLWILYGDKYLRAAAIFGSVLFACSIAILIISQPSSSWLQPVCDSYSITYVGIACAVFLYWGLLYALSERFNQFRYRLSASLTWAVIIMAATILLFPQCLADPYGEMDADLARMWQPVESQSILENPQFALPFLATPFFALLITVINVYRNSGHSRKLWTVSLIFLLISLLLNFWQVRFGAFSSVFSIIPIACLIQQIVKNLGTRLSGVFRVTLLLSLTAIFTLAPMTMILAAFGGSNEVAASQQAYRRCDLSKAADILNTMKAPHTIASSINIGSEILYRTHHSVIAISFHRNSRNNSELFQMFSGKTDEVALEKIQKNEINLILVCPQDPEMNFYRNRGFETFYQRLENRNLPEWLKELELPVESNYLLFEKIP